MTWDQLLTWYGRAVFPKRVDKEKPKVLVWSSQSHDFRELRSEHLTYDPLKNEIRVVLDEVHGE